MNAILNLSNTRAVKRGQNKKISSARSKGNSGNSRGSNESHLPPNTGLVRTQFSTLATVDDPISGSLAHMRRIQPYAASKHYVCPGCNQEIAPGIGHVVIVPLEDAANRRHWHTSCWERKRKASN